MALYQKLPRSRLKSNMDGEDTILSYRNASPKARASAAAYSAPPSARKANRLDLNRGQEKRFPPAPAKKTPVDMKKVVQGVRDALAPTITAKGQRGLTPARLPVPTKAPDASLAKRGRSNTPPLKKASATPQAYTGEKGDTKKKSGAVTSYQKDGYTYTKNSKGVFQNFSAAKTPYKPKGK